MPTHPRTPLRAVAVSLVALILSAAPHALAADTWAWFAEPFEVEVATEHPQAGAITGRIVVGPQAVRTEWHVGGMVQVSVARLAGDAVAYVTLLPDGSVQSFTLTGADAHEMLVQGYVAAVTEPEDARHPCTRSPDTHRCSFEAQETVDARSLERWRIEADDRSGQSVWQLFWFDREAGLVVRALDQTGAELVFSGHARGGIDPAEFELP
jgi:hypothetical protein